MHDVKILETTIRDGSYEVGFQFTLEDVARMGSLLDQAGFSFIEIAHGSGLGGAAFGEPAAASDEDYLRVGRAAVKRAKLGALMGFNRRTEAQIMDKLRFCADEGVDFIRMGFVPSNSENPVILKAIELAAKLGLTVSTNFMRTYCETPERLADKAKKLESLGVKWGYLVDSAGGMTPQQVASYVKALKERTELVVGFHGHNNTQMAVANSLAAIDAGAAMVDGSLQGLGRATGNAPTEILTALVQERYGQDLGIDRATVFSMGREMIRPWIRPGFDPTDVLSGVRNVHSSCLRSVRAAAKTHGLASDDVLAEAGKRAGEAGKLERRDLPEDILSAACAHLSAAPAKTEVDTSRIADQVAQLHKSTGGLSSLISQLKVSALRDHRRSLLLLTEESLFGAPELHHRGEWTVGIFGVKDALSSSEQEALQKMRAEGWLDTMYVDRALPQLQALDAQTVPTAELIARSLGIKERFSQVAIEVEHPGLAEALNSQFQQARSSPAQAILVQGTAGRAALKAIMNLPEDTSVVVMDGALWSDVGALKARLLQPDLSTMLIANRLLNHDPTPSRSAPEHIRAAVEGDLQALLKPDS